MARLRCNCPEQFRRISHREWSRDQLLRVFTISLIGLAFLCLLWFLRTTFGPSLGAVLYLALSATGSLSIRIGRELAYVIVYVFGVAGLNTSGREGSDPFVGVANFPWVLLSLSLLAVGFLNRDRITRMLARRAAKVKETEL